VPQAGFTCETVAGINSGEKKKRERRNMRRIAVITSGGDAPGMNAAINAVFRAGRDNGMEIYGIRRGYQGLMEDDIFPMTLSDVTDILQLGGTFLGTARCEEFKEEEAQARSIRNLEKRGIEGLIVIGGNGSQRGAHDLYRRGFPVVGVASTVDNDLYGSDISIGVDTALDTIIECIDRIRTTAESHHRAFLIEVMGRDFGYLALMAGLASGAEVVVTPEFEMEPDEVIRELRQAHESGKRYALVLVTDGAENSVSRIASYIRDHVREAEFELRVTILGHVQRGGSPNTFDRILATRLGVAAVELMHQGKAGLLVGLRDGKVAHTPLEEVVSRKKDLDMELWLLGRKLAR
jgi:6-phosphofructokinase 1